jgi:hypothetical protein
MRILPSTRTVKDDPKETALAPCSEKRLTRRVQRGGEKQRTRIITPALLTAVPFFPQRSTKLPAARLATSPPTVYAAVTIPKLASVNSTQLGRPNDPLCFGRELLGSQMMEVEMLLRAAML